MINRIANDLSNRSIAEIMDDMTGVNKFDLIRDCINYQRLLFGFGIEEYADIVHDPSSVFDILIELSVDELQAFNLALSGACSRKAHELINNNR